MAYVKQTWVDGEDGNTPLSAARLNYAEGGIEAAASTADTAQTTADAAIPSTEKGVANGVATLGADGLVPDTQLPPDVGVTDHGFLTGLADDDHTQYALANGSRGNFETAGAVATHEGLPNPHPFRGCKVHLSVAQSIPTGSTSESIDFETEVWDQGGWHDPASNPSRLTVPAGLGGWIALTGVAAMFGTAGTYREVRIHKNGAVASVINFPPAQFGRYLISDVFEVVAGDFFEMYVQQDSGAAINATTDTFLSVHYLGG